MQTVTLYLSAYIVGTVLLNSYSAFGMPVSTTATLVFCLAGGAIGVTGDLNAVNWPTFSKVVAAIIISIFLTGLGGFFIQRILGGRSVISLTIIRPFYLWPMDFRSHPNFPYLVHGNQGVKRYICC